jgi:hypothetical protein
VAGGRWQEAASRRQVAGGRKQEAACRRQVAGGRKQVIESKRQVEGGRWKLAESRNLMTENGSRSIGSLKKASVIRTRDIGTEIHTGSGHSSIFCGVHAWEIKAI